jgi:SHS2 domain-containing protein
MAMRMQVAQTRWEHFEHGADIGVRGIGRTKEQAFEQAALAMVAVITDPRAIRHACATDIACSAPNDELLLVDWLNAVIYEMATRGLIFSRFEVRIGGGVLQGRAWGERMDTARHQPAVETKGATYTALRVGDEPDGTWVAQCVVDV